MLARHAAKATGTPGAEATPEPRWSRACQSVRRAAPMPPTTSRESAKRARSASSGLSTTNGLVEGEAFAVHARWWPPKRVRAHQSRPSLPRLQRAPSPVTCHVRHSSAPSLSSDRRPATPIRGADRASRGTRRRRWRVRSRPAHASGVTITPLTFATASARPSSGAMVRVAPFAETSTRAPPRAPASGCC